MEGDEGRLFVRSASFLGTWEFSVVFLFFSRGFSDLSLSFSSFF